MSTDKSSHGSMLFRIQLLAIFLAIAAIDAAFSAAGPMKATT
jgi:hypothetical protein